MVYNIFVINKRLNCDMLTSYLIDDVIIDQLGNCLRTKTKKTKKICSLRRAWRFAPHVKMYSHLSCEYPSS